MNRILLAIILTGLLAVTLLPAKEYPPVQLPKVEKQMMENGLTVLYVEHHELPVMTLRMVIKVGSAADPSGKEGLGNFVADLLTEGSGGKSAMEIATKVESFGGSLASSSGDADNSWAELSMLKKHLDEGMPIFTDMCLHPDFPDKEIERFRRQYLADFESEKDQPNSVIFNLLRKTGFAGTPYSHKPQGNAKGIKGIAKQDILDFYKKWYRPNNAILIISGDITRKEMQPIVEKAFGKWTADVVPTLDYGKLQPVSGRRIILIDKPDLDQAYIAFYRPGTKRNNPEYFPQRVMDYILGGGGFASRLMMEVREKAGLTYDVASFFWMNLNQGLFATYTFTKNATVGEATTKILAEFDKMRNAPVSDKELDDAVSNFCGSFPRDFETPRQIASRYTGVELYGLGDNYLRDFRKNYGAVTKEQIQSVAKKYLDSQNIVIVVFGNAKAIKAQLDPIGPVEVQEYTKYED